MKLANRSQSRLPSETFAISSTLNCAIWSVVGLTGRHRIHWKLSRINPEGESFSLLKVEQLLEFPGALAILAGGFAKIESLDRDLREDLLKMERLMEDVHNRLQANGEHEKAETDQPIFRR